MSFHSLSVKETENSLNTNINKGLTSEEAKKRLEKYGENCLKAQKKVPFIKKLAEQFNDFMIIVLLIAAAISFLVSLAEGKPDFIEPAIILSIVILNAVLGLIQEERAQKAIDSLKALSSPNAMVLRNGGFVTIESKKLVPGDIMRIEAGHLISADARIISSEGLSIDEAPLTGESCPVLKTSDKLPENTPFADTKNMVFSSTMCVSGHGMAVVTATGMNAVVGKIANMIDNTETIKTPLQKKLAKTGKILGYCSCIICAAIFIIGLIKGLPVVEMFMTSVSLAVAAIPEGLPAVVTIMLSMGVLRLAAKNAVIRKLPAVETLGSATYICSDKTGTLTKNEMTVVSAYLPDFGIVNPPSLNSEQYNSYKKLMLAFSLCSNAGFQADGSIFADPTEKALFTAASSDKTLLMSTLTKNKKVAELPFSHTKKRMTTFHTASEGSFMLTKGAFDYILPLCTHIYQNGKVIPLTNTIINELKNKNSFLTKNALRVIACAGKKLDRPPALPVNNSNEHSLVFIGMAGLLDPPRPEAYTAVKQCITAGITPVMITGDHLNTACAIAKKIGILTNDTQAITGSELDKMSDEEFAANLKKYRVFARVSPEHKIKIVRALQKKGEVTAMTGDGVNDAPALKAADIGCAMGITGTDVAKNSADMILMNDNFATIVNAVKEGRGIYDNIKKAVHFLLSSNIGEIITIFMAILFGLPSPLSPVQLLWINLVTDSLPAIALGMEPPEEDIMSRPPVPVSKSIFSDGAGIRMFLEGALIGMASLTAYMLGGSTMAFAVLGISQLFHAFNLKSSHSIFTDKFFNNKSMILSFIICMSLQIAVITVPSISSLLEITPLTMDGWIIVMLLSLILVPVVEIQKWFNNYKI